MSISSSTLWGCAVLSSHLDDMRHIQRYMFLPVLIFALVVVSSTGTAAAVPNPMRPPRAARSTRRREPRWRLEGILGVRRQRIAVIDGHIVRPGMRIAGARVVRIGRRSVTLVIAHGIVTLHVLAHGFLPSSPRNP